MAELLFESKEQAPEAIRAALAERDGKFVFRYEPPERLAEFRDNNVRLTQEREQLQQQVSRFNGLDPEKAQQALKRLQELEDKKLIEAGNLEELVKQRAERELAKLRDAYEPKLKEASQERDAFLQENQSLRAELEGHLLERDLTKAAGEKKIKPNKLPYLFTMARHGDMAGTRWVRKDGRMVALRGEEQLEISFSDWIDGLVKADPDLVIPSSGGGAPGGTGGAGNRSPKDTAGLSPRALVDAAFSRL